MSCYLPNPEQWEEGTEHLPEPAKRHRYIERDAVGGPPTFMPGNSSPRGTRQGWSQDLLLRLHSPAGETHQPHPVLPQEPRGHRVLLMQPGDQLPASACSWVSALSICPDFPPATLLLPIQFSQAHCLSPAWCLLLSPGLTQRDTDGPQ